MSAKARNEQEAYIDAQVEFNGRASAKN